MPPLVFVLEVRLDADISNISSVQQERTIDTGEGMSRFLKLVMRRAAALLMLPAFIAACGVAPGKDAMACVTYDSSPAAIRQRVMIPGNIDRNFMATSCVSEPASTGIYEEACIVATNDRANKPTFSSGAWTRETITFVPNSVQKLAQAESITIATKFEKEATQVYADANLARAVVYKQFDTCEASG